LISFVAPVWIIANLREMHAVSSQVARGTGTAALQRPRPAHQRLPGRSAAGLRVHARVEVAPSTSTKGSGTKKPDFQKVDLPPLAKDYVPPGALPDDAFGVDRPATALVLEPEGVKPGAKVPCVLFCHGFSQPPTNYLSTLKEFTKQGWLVVAPTTSILDVGLPWKSVETIPKGKPPAKLQTALILDALRSAQYALQGKAGYKVSDILVCGHSMGGAAGVVTASKLKQEIVTGVGVMAPAVNQTAITPVNPLLGNMGKAAGQKTAKEFFDKDYPINSPLHILGGTRDLIVMKKEVAGLYKAAFDSDKDGDLKLYWIKGSHIGFEDKVNVEVDTGFLQSILFNIINFLLYGAEITEIITGDYSDQREASQNVLVKAFKGALAGEGWDGKAEQGQWEVVKSAKDVSLKEILPKPEVPPAEQPWVLPTVLLLSYSALHALTLSEGVQLYAGFGSDLSGFSALGLGALTVIAAGLVYENVVLAAGRFITDKGTKNIELLDALNDPRFLFHSAAPLLSITGLDLAQRLGVGWASNPWVEGGVALSCAVVVALSALRNTLLLQTKPTWSGGIFHFTFDDKSLDFTRIIPVAATTLLLTALGVSAALDDHSQWAFAAGPAICLALSAGLIPRSVAPMILTGNAGEALLLASLMITEAGLLGQHFLLN